VYENHPALYILAFGMAAAKVTNKLVVSEHIHVKSEVLIVLNIEVMVSYDMMPLSANISDELAVGSFGVKGGSSMFLQNVGSHLCGVMSQKTIILRPVYKNERLRSVPLPCFKNRRNKFSFLTLTANKDQWACTSHHRKPGLLDCAQAHHHSRKPVM
jgi:hypothetical protein